MTLRRPLFAPSLLALAGALTACALPPQTGVQRMYDGVFKAPDEAQALAYCRIDGAPIRILEQPRGEDLPKNGVLFRCD